MRAKKKTQNDYYASLNANDKWNTIYTGMLKHKNYKKLSIGARMFYIYCRANAFEGRAVLYRHGKEENKTYSDNVFCFTSSQQAEYGVDRANGKRWFDELIKAGFIEVVEQNKHRMRVNVYAFSSKWKDDS